MGGLSPMCWRRGGLSHTQHMTRVVSTRITFMTAPFQPLSHECSEGIDYSPFLVSLHTKPLCLLPISIHSYARVLLELPSSPRMGLYVFSCSRSSAGISFPPFPQSAIQRPRKTLSLTLFLIDICSGIRPEDFFAHPL